jgi:glycosyltransferase involved in cell wall biosynthesis
MASIVTVYNDWRQEFRPVEMAYIRWLKISESLSRLGHRVDIATNETFKWWRPGKFPVQVGENLRRVSLRAVRWADYDVVKTLFHTGFDTLEKRRGTGHPFIISKLGSIVAPEERDGIYFYGAYREKLYSTQKKIDAVSTYITVLSQPARALWEACFGPKTNILLIPGATDRQVPTPTRDPFPKGAQMRCLFAGNVYGKQAQPEANRVLVDKLNRLGRLLSGTGIRLYMLGPGDVSELDRRHVTYLGVAPYAQTWDYFHFAHVGIVVAPGSYLHNNESTKIYHYLRVGLPVVSEAGFPNDHVVRESQLGFVVENGNLDLMAERIQEAVRSHWNRDFAVQYILANHTWDKRAETYDAVIRKHSG